MIASLRSTWILLGALALGLALACGGEKEEAAPAGKTPAESWRPAPPPERRPPPSSPPVVGRELPADFPADVPIYPGAKVVESRVSPSEGTSVTLSVGDDVDKVVSFYADGLAAQGWSTDIKKSPDGSVIFADKSDRHVGTMVRKTDDGTEIRLILVKMQ